MYYIDSEPPDRLANNETKENIAVNSASTQHSFPPPPTVFKIETSPTPSSDLSTLTNSFHSVGHQFNSSHLFNPRPQFEQYLSQATQENQYRHSSSSIDHKSLSLTKFDQQQQLQQQQQQQAVSKHHQPTGRYCSYHQRLRQQQQESLLLQAKRSNSFNQHQNGRRFEDPRRSSVNFTGSNSSSTRLLSYQRHLLSPRPEPPKPPVRVLSSNSSSLKAEVSINKLAEMDKNQQIPANNLMNQPGTDSLDNIQMIMDEDDKGNFERFMFATCDEPNKMNTIKSANSARNRDSTSPIINNDLINRQLTIENENLVIKQWVNRKWCFFVDLIKQSNLSHSLATQTNQMDNSATENRKSSSNTTNGHLMSGLEYVVQFDDLNLQQIEPTLSYTDNGLGNQLQGYQASECHQETQTTRQPPRLIYDARKYTLNKRDAYAGNSIREAPLIWWTR